MKTYNKSNGIIILIIVAMTISSILAILGCKTIPERTGAFEFTSGTYEVDGVSYPADVSTLVVPENRNDPASRQIEIPVIRILSTGENPAEPVFLFAGGPGDPNIWKHPPV